MKIYYRISDNSYKKNRIASKERCFINFMRTFGPEHEIKIYMDRMLPEKKLWLEETMQGYKERGRNIILEQIPEHEGGSSAQSWQYVYKKSLTEVADNEIVYYAEDDYMYLENADNILIELLERADMATVYTHSDRFLPAAHGGNKFVDDTGTYMTRVGRTKSTYFSLVESTTMTFATTGKILRATKDIWNKYTLGKHPNDFGAFCELQQAGFTLVSPIPTYATHCDVDWLSSLIGTRYESWKDVWPENYDKE